MQPATPQLVRDWGGFEDFVAELNKTGDVEVQRNVILNGVKGVSRQIDVLITHKQGLYTHRILVECKYWKGKIKRMHVDAMVAAVDDLQAASGVFFTTQGCQKGAVEAFADGYLLVARANEKPSSIASKEMILRVHLKPAFAGKRLDEIGYGEIVDYAAAKAKKLSKKTVNNHLTCLRRILVVAKKRGLIATVPEIEWLTASTSRRASSESGSRSRRAR